MSWETQGRQYHQWFGHGAAGVEGVVAPKRDLADAVGDAAVAALGGERGAALAGALRDGGTGWLREALPVWVGASGRSASAFGALVGPELGAGAGVSALQAASRVLAFGVTEAGVQEAGVALSIAVSGQDAGRTRYALRAGRDGRCMRRAAVR